MTDSRIVDRDTKIERLVLEIGDHELVSLMLLSYK